jgi:hypothetical protein
MAVIIILFSPVQAHFFSSSFVRVARFILIKHTKNGKIYQMTITYIKWPCNIPKYTKVPQNIPKGHKNIPTSFSERPSKIYPNRDFGFENVPSGNPAVHDQESLSFNL